MPLVELQAKYSVQNSLLTKFESCFCFDLLNFFDIAATFCNLLRRNQLFIFPLGPLGQTLVDPLATLRHTVGWWGSSPPTDGCPGMASFL